MVIVVVEECQHLCLGYFLFYSCFLRDAREFCGESNRDRAAGPGSLPHICPRGQEIQNQT